ncbi:unnamed protein product [marine sediment metagenome]|uniref:Uncharacterized protein n=1 Tax=marine sediment metagenome TaxID=412755 RepID=X0RY47_9ZZZZ
MPDKPTDEEKVLALSAKDAHVLIVMINSEGWKVIKRMYFDVSIKKIRKYLDDTKNTDMHIIQGKRELINWIQKLLDDIKLTIDIGLANEKELAERVKLRKIRGE